MRRGIAFVRAHARTSQDFALSHQIAAPATADGVGLTFNGRLPTPAVTELPWLALADALAQLGIESSVVDGPDFISLMEGRRPRSGGWLRQAGADGSRGGGIDGTFSAPKSVSVTWALGDEHERRVIEQAHRAAVDQAIGPSVR
jgi:TrwC relaxase